MKPISEGELKEYSKCMRIKKRIADCILKALVNELGQFDSRFGVEQIVNDNNCKYVIMQNNSNHFQALVFMNCAGQPNENAFFSFRRLHSNHVEIRPNGLATEIWKDCTLENKTSFRIFSTVLIRAKLYKALQAAVMRVNSSKIFGHKLVNGVQLKYCNILLIKSELGDIEIEIAASFYVANIEKNWFKLFYKTQPTFAIAKYDWSIDNDPECSWRLLFFKEDDLQMKRNSKLIDHVFLFAKRFNLKVLNRDRILSVLSLIINSHESEVRLSEFLHLLVGLFEERCLLSRYDYRSYNLISNEKETDIVKIIYECKRYLRLSH